MTVPGEDVRHPRPVSCVDTPLEFEDEWAEESDRRIDEMLDGTVTPVPGGEVLRAALRRLK